MNPREEDVETTPEIMSR